MPGVCQALSKYCVKNFPLSVKDALLLAAEKEPEMVYAISCRYALLSNVTNVAAKNTLRNVRRLDNLPDNIVAEINTLQYRAIAKYQAQCRIEAFEVCRPEALKTPFSETPGATEIYAPTDEQTCSCAKDDQVIMLFEMFDHPEFPDVSEYQCLLPARITRYMRDVRNDLNTGEVVSGSVALKSEHMAKAIDAARGCSVCSKETAKFFNFAHSLEQLIDKAVSFGKE